MKVKKARKTSDMVIRAIRKLEEKNGPSAKDIVKFISHKISVDSEHVKPYVQAALKRGLDSGAIVHDSGQYRLREDIAPVELKRRRRKKGKKGKKRKRGGDIEELGGVLQEAGLNGALPGPGFGERKGRRRKYEFDESRRRKGRRKGRKGKKKRKGKKRSIEM